MHKWSKEQGRFLKAALDRPAAKVTLGVFAAVASWDTVLAQLLPKSLAHKLPTFYDVAIMTGGLLPWYWWVIIGLLILLAFVVEFGLRRGRKISEGEPSATLRGHAARVPNRNDGPTESPPPRPDKSLNNEWMPLNEAARELFELTENEIVGHFAAAGNSPDEILDFYGVYITQTPKIIPLYGKRPPSTKRQLISADEVRNLRIKDGATVLEEMYDPHHKYIDLEIKRSDFDVSARKITDGTR